MGKQLIIQLPDDVYHKYKSIAQSSNRDVSDVVTETVIEAAPIFAIHPRSDEMNQEEAAYLAMHDKLFTTYPYSYVAIYQQKLIDHDEDIVILAQRIRQKYPDEVVLITQVLPEPTQTLQVRSPRIIRSL